MEEILNRIEALSYWEKKLYKKQLILFSGYMSAKDAVLAALDFAELIGDSVVTYPDDFIIPL